jgi:hypothetical protein
MGRRGRAPPHTHWVTLKTGSGPVLVFDHVGLTTTEPRPDDNRIDQSRRWVTNPRNHPEHMEFPRHASGTTVPEGVRASPHVAYRVQAMEPHMEGQDILTPPFVVGHFVRVVFVRKYGMVFEYMQYLNDTWFSA